MRRSYEELRGVISGAVMEETDGNGIPLKEMIHTLKIGPTYLRQILDELGYEIDDNDGDPVGWVKWRTL